MPNWTEPAFKNALNVQEEMVVSTSDLSLDEMVQQL